MGLLAAVPTGSEVDPCCCPAAECCLYPWPDPDGDFGGPFYPDTDLPATLDVTLGGTYGGETATLTRTGYVYSGTSTPSGFTVEIRPGLLVDGEDYFWHGSVDGDGATFACLIGAWATAEIALVEDVFTDTYTATYGGYDPITITRQNLCEWTGNGVGTEGQLYTVRVYYEPSDYKWHVEVVIDGSTNFDWVKDDPQDSPEGDFEGNLVVTP